MDRRVLGTDCSDIQMLEVRGRHLRMFIIIIVRNRRMSNNKFWSGVSGQIAGDILAVDHSLGPLNTASCLSSAAVSG